VLNVALAATVAVVTALIVGPLCRAWGGREAATQSLRADREQRRAEAAERNVALLTFACEQASVQLHNYRSALAHRAGRKQAGRG
jgi:hypothetical protein